MGKNGLLKLVEDSLEVTRETVNKIDENELTAFFNKLIEVREAGNKIFVAASGRSLLVMKAFAMRLMQIDFETYVVGDVVTPAIGENDLLIIASGSGNTKTLVLFAKQAISQNASVILLTREEESCLSEIVHNVLRVPTKLAENNEQSDGSLFEETLFIMLDQCIVLIAYLLKYFNSYANYNEIVRHRHANLQ